MQRVAVINCTRHTTTHQFIWHQQKCAALGGSPMECGVVSQHCEIPYFHPRHRNPTSWNGPSKNSVDPAEPPPHQCRTFPLLFAQMWYGPYAACKCGVEEQTVDHVVLQCPIYRPPQSSWTARPDGSGRWDDPMAAQHLRCSTFAPRSSAAKQWLEQLAQNKKICCCLCTLYAYPHPNPFHTEKSYLFGTQTFERAPSVDGTLGKFCFEPKDLEKF